MQMYYLTDAGRCPKELSGYWTSVFESSGTAGSSSAYSVVTGELRWSGATSRHQADNEGVAHISLHFIACACVEYIFLKIASEATKHDLLIPRGAARCLAAWNQERANDWKQLHPARHVNEPRCSFAHSAGHKCSGNQQENSDLTPSTQREA